MHPWKISVGLTAIILALALMLAGENFAWTGPHLWIIADHWMPVAWYAGLAIAALMFALYGGARLMGLARHGPEGGPDGAIHPPGRGRAERTGREDGAGGTRRVSGELTRDDSHHKGDKK